MLETGVEFVAPPPAREAVAPWAGRAFYQLILNVHWILVRALRWRKPVPSDVSRLPKTVLLTGTFYSESWILNHLRPLQASQQCDRVWLVTTFAIPQLENVEAIYPPAWLVRVLGDVPARLLVFVLTALRRRPDFVGGFHLLPNGLLALLLARLVGRRCVYICGGGAWEVEGGGYYADSRSFRFLKGPDTTLELALLRAVNEIDLVITMGSSASKFFRTRGVNTRIEVVPGGIDSGHFTLDDLPKTYDLILVGRLLPVKRIDLFLRTVAKLSERLPNVSAVIVGGGELEDSLKRLAVELGVNDRVHFAGQQPDVRPWLAQSRIFVLTSASEGLSLALMEAMTAGLPCVVTNVGELGELVEHDKTGFLVNEHSPEAFCSFLEPLLENELLRGRFAEASKQAAGRVTVAETAKRWDRVLSGA